MQSDFSRLLVRIDRLLAEQLRDSQKIARSPVHLSRWEVGGEPVPFEDAIKGEYSPFSVGLPWGRAWDTTWFRVEGAVPETWRDYMARPDRYRIELDVDLGFRDELPGFQAEGLAYTSEGRILKGIHPRNQQIPMSVHAGSEFEIFIEAASNPQLLSESVGFRPTELGEPRLGDGPIYRLRKVELSVRDIAVAELHAQLTDARGLLVGLPGPSSRSDQIARAVEEALREIDNSAISDTAGTALEKLHVVFDAPAAPSAHRLVAMAHAHIDSAWLWPFRETVRKCIRTFANALALMDEYPDLVFVCSAAQHLAWVRDAAPELFARVRGRVAEGRFVLAGGMWVESDTNLPGGESLIRQFAEGRRFFAEEFGVETREVWLPDTFGYSAALPQIIRGTGAEWFFTQKINWNDRSRMPHHTFRWAGIDGSSVIAHFPSVDRYDSDVSVTDLLHAERSFADRAIANVSVLPFGWGDGGGGATRETVRSVTRLSSVEGLPSLTWGTPDSFLRLLRDTVDEASLSTWSGEMYLEFHRGTYTSQARAKTANRAAEAALHAAELWAADAALRRGQEYPYTSLRELWRAVLLLQFHDVLPGTSIAWVHREAQERYDEVLRGARAIIEAALPTAVNSGVCANAAPVEIDGIPAGGYGAPSAVHHETWISHDGRWLIEGSQIRAELDINGELVSLVDRASGRELVPHGQSANRVRLYRDQPGRWDAWDIDESYRQMPDGREPRVDIAADPDGSLIVIRTWGDTVVRQRLSLRRDQARIDIEFDIDWHERERLLRFENILALQAERSRSEIQFGAVERATHSNTTWEEGKFEFCAHRYIHLAEGEFAVTLANNTVHGHSARRLQGVDGYAIEVGASLLRSPLFPDPTADEGRHRITMAIALGTSVVDAVRLGYELNTDLREVSDGCGTEPLVRSSNPAILVETVKLADDLSGDLVIRLYDCVGQSASTKVRLAIVPSRVCRTDLLERETGHVPFALEECAWFEASLGPYEIATYRVTKTMGGPGAVDEKEQ